MIKEVYSVRDRKSGYGPLMLADNEAIAVRNFSVSVQQTDSLMHWCAADYSLYRTGTFDDEQGILTAELTPQFIVEAIDFVEKEGVKS